MRDCLGKLKYSAEFLHSDSDAAQHLYASIVPISLIYDHVTQIYEVIAMSRHFRALIRGESIPLYKCNFHVNEEKIITSLEFKEVT